MRLYHPPLVPKLQLGNEMILLIKNPELPCVYSHLNCYLIRFLYNNVFNVF